MVTQEKMPQVSTGQPNLSNGDAAQIIKSVGSQHPALSRLQKELRSESGTGAITSYDRMHHRHNRS
ncbi:MAG: hypothetical protein EOP04_19495 [Proteobacteria bacterium]|nr:MAG: hypothetical protein EOP04_19495 [Pseudomonadota bacterium]